MRNCRGKLHGVHGNIARVTGLFVLLALFVHTFVQSSLSFSLTLKYVLVLKILLQKFCEILRSPTAVVLNLMSTLVLTDYENFYENLFHFYIV